MNTNKQTKKQSKIISIHQLPILIIISLTNTFSIIIVHYSEILLQFSVIFCTITIIYDQIIIKIYIYIYKQQQKMATLQALAISGIRSYATNKMEKILFANPVTLIHGKNGSGKTTVIQCLKYITTGEFPPGGGKQKGKLFVMDPKISKQPETVGDIRLRFRTAKGRQIIAKKTCTCSSTAKGLSFKSVEQSLRTKDEEQNDIEINQRCADIDKQMPQLLGMTKPVLQNIVFCHQDDSLWPFSEEAHLKKIFDELFDTRRFSKAMERMKQALKEFQKQRNFLRGQIGPLQQRFRRFKQARGECLHQLLNVVKQSNQIRILKQELAPINQKLAQNGQKIQQLNVLNRSKGALEAKLIICREQTAKFEKQLQKFPYSFKQYTKQQSQQKLKNIKQSISNLQKEAQIIKNNLIQVRQRQDAEKNKRQLYLQIKRAKQLVPELSRCESYKQYQKQLRKIVRDNKEKSDQYKKLRSKYENIYVPLSGGIQSQNLQAESKNKYLAWKEKKLEVKKIEEQLAAGFRYLFRNQDQQLLGDYSQQKGKKLHEKLDKLKAQFEMKKQELQLYKSKKTKQQSPEQQIFKLTYVGIELQEHMLDYIRIKKQCLLCTQRLDKEVMQRVKNKINGTMNETKKRISQIKNENKNTQSFDVKPLIIGIEKYLEDTRNQINILQQQFDKYQKHKRIKKQVTLNNELKKTIQQLKINIPKNSSSTQMTIQQFRELANRLGYSNLVAQNIEKQCRSLKHKIQQNENLTNQIKSKKIQKEEIKKELMVLQKQIQNNQIIENISLKISSLCQQIEAQKNQDSSADNGESSSEDLQNYLNSIYKKINQEKKLLIFWEIVIQYIDSNKKQQAAQQGLEQMTKKVMAAESHYNMSSQLQKQKTKLEIDIAKKQQKVSLITRQCVLSIPEENLYLKKKVRLNAINGMVADVQASLKAMDRAISRLHDQKMDEVNRILYDIWLEVYHGKDIEYIQISSVNEKKNKIGYGYCILMKKNGEMLQMKGRCSTGQKVLASLIIRIALAQAFSANTHILTLDEPTTNLDKFHIQKLAEAIGNILDMQNSRLQLIVISHDIQFIKLLSKYTNSYYEVKRNQQNFSTLTKKDISELQQRAIQPHARILM